MLAQLPQAGCKVVTELMDDIEAKLKSEPCCDMSKGLL